MTNCPLPVPAAYVLNSLANTYVHPANQAAYHNGIDSTLCPALSCSKTAPSCGIKANSKVGCTYAAPANEIFACETVQCLPLACYCKVSLQPKCQRGYESYHSVATPFACAAWSACMPIPT